MAARVARRTEIEKLFHPQYGHNSRVASDAGSLASQPRF
jgi:hypothetical protein